MVRRDVEIEIRTWAFRDRELPRVPPAGWAATTDRLREAVCLAVERSVDGIERVEPFEGPARERERFEATVVAGDDDHRGDATDPENATDAGERQVADDIVDLGEFADEYVRLLRSRSTGSSSKTSSDDATAANGADPTAAENGTGVRSGDDFEERTEQFDLDEALDRL